MLRSAFVGMVKSSLGLPLVGVPTPKASLPPSAGTIVQCGPAARFMSSRASPIFGSPSSMADFPAGHHGSRDKRGERVMSSASGGADAHLRNIKDEECDPLVTEPNSYGGGNGGAYATIAVLQAGLALPAYLVPHETAEFLFGAAALPHIALHVPLVRLLAVGLVASAGGALGLMGAAERADLNRRVFQRLNLGLLTLAGTAAAMEALYLPIFTPAGLAAGAAASLPALLVSGYHYQRTSGHGANPLPVLAGAAKSVGSLVSNRTSAARLYSLLTAALTGAGAAYLLAPQSSLAAVLGAPGSLGWAPSRLDAEVLWRMMGGALLALAPWTYSLKGGADADLLWRRPFPLLNAGLALVSAAHMLLLGPLLIGGVSGTWMPVVVGTWGLALCTSTYHWLKNVGPK